MTRSIQPAGQSAGPKPLRNPPGVVAPLRILLVEDDAMIAHFLGDVLLELGHSICDTASTENEAVAAAARHSPDLVIVDLHLAGGDGVAAVGKIQRAGHVPHLFMTGGNTERIPPQAAILRKPFGVDDLIRGLASALDPVRFASWKARRTA